MVFGSISSNIHALLLLGSWLPCSIAQNNGPRASVQDGPPNNCNAWHTVKEGDDCDNISNLYRISREKFVKWNAVISKDCLENLHSGSAYCVGVETRATTRASFNSTTALSIATEGTFKSAVGGSNSTTARCTRSRNITTSSLPISVDTTYSVRVPLTSWSITTLSIDSAWPPKATQSGQPAACNRWHLVSPGSRCDTILKRYATFMTPEQFFEWNPELHNDCSGLYVDYWVCVGVRSNDAGPGLSWTTSTTAFTSPPKPTSHKPTTYLPVNSSFTVKPTQSPMPEGCQNFHQAASDETCREILAVYNYISWEKFFEWNPALQNDCDGLLADHWYCVGLKQELPMPPTMTETPKTIPTGSPDDCKSWYYTTRGDTCAGIAAMFGTFNVEDFIAWNPIVLASCPNIEDHVWYCVGKADSPTMRTWSTPVRTGQTEKRPIQSGISGDCESYWLVSKLDTCESIARANDITKNNLFNWNKAVGSDCSGLKPDYYVCVGVSVDSGGTSVPSVKTAAGPTVSSI